MRIRYHFSSGSNCSAFSRWLGVVAGDRRTLQSRRALSVETGGGLPRRPGRAAAGGENTGANLRWPGRTLRLADGTCVSKPASKGTDWRVHGVFDLASGGFSHLELTDQHGAEALERGAPIAGEIRIGDRNYARVPVLKRFLANACGKADFIVRLGWNALRFAGLRWRWLASARSATGGA